jgi:hypothetical protein
MMRAAQEHQVVQAGLTPVCPMFDVMGIAPRVGAGAGRAATPTVSKHAGATLPLTQLAFPSDIQWFRRTTHHDR